MFKLLALLTDANMEPLGVCPFIIKLLILLLFFSTVIAFPALEDINSICVSII